MERKKSEEEKGRVILFKLSGENWGIRFGDIQEVFEAKEITPVPKTPPFILGIVNLRGRIITIIDLALLIGATQTKEENPKILCLKSEEMNIGLLLRSKIALASLANESWENGSVVKENITEDEPILKRRIVRKDKIYVHLLDGKDIIAWLAHYRFH